MGSEGSEPNSPPGALDFALNLVQESQRWKWSRTGLWYATHSEQSQGWDDIPFSHKTGCAPQRLDDQETTTSEP